MDLGESSASLQSSHHEGGLNDLLVAGELLSSQHQHQQQHQQHQQAERAAAVEAAAGARGRDPHAPEPQAPAHAMMQAASSDTLESGDASTQSGGGPPQIMASSVEVHLQRAATASEKNETMETAEEAVRGEGAECLM